MGKVISFTNKKGGVGKTTTCVNMAAYIANAGRKVLLVDMDPQGNATTGLGFSKSTLKKSVYNVLIDGEEGKKILKKLSIYAVDLTGIMYRGKVSAVRKLLAELVAADKA